MVPLVIKPVADFPEREGGCLVTVSIIYVIFGGVISPETNSQYKCIASGSAHSPHPPSNPAPRVSCFHHFALLKVKRQPQPAPVDAEPASVVVFSCAFSTHARTHSDEPVTASFPPPLHCRGTNVHETVTLGGSACQGKCSCRG